MNWNNTISGDGRNPRSQIKVHLLPQMLQTWVVELVIFKNRPKSTKEILVRFELFPSFSVCLCLFIISMCGVSHAV